MKRKYVSGLIAGAVVLAPGAVVYAALSRSPTGSVWA